tara:strand:+ start:271 stop:1209 length:939 start_codon:yes stop_codon:yes gene_type:complete
MAITIDGTDGISPLKASGQVQTTTGTAAAPAIASSSDTDSGFFFGTNEVNISTGGSTRATVDSSGRLGIGTTSPGAELEIKKTSTPVIRLNQNDTFYAPIKLAGNDLEIRGSSGQIEFYTGAANGDSSTERLVIGTDGHLYSTSNSSSLTNLTLRNGSSSDGTDFLQCRDNANNEECTIKDNGDLRNANNSYGSVSDVKLKENIVDASSQWDDIKAIQVRNYNFKEQTGYESHTQLGVIAQEIETVSSGLVSESPDRDEDGNDLGTVTKSVKYSVLYMKAVKALQEAQTRVETLETQHADLLARVTALEAAE